jgi:hypothetical protein
MDALAFHRFAGQTRTGKRAVSETDFGEEDREDWEYSDIIKNFHKFFIKNLSLNIWLKILLE